MNNLLGLSLFSQAKASFPVKGNKNAASREESNDQVIRKMQDIASSAPLNKDEIKEFVTVLIKNFKWRTADPKEVEMCKNAVLDLVSVDGSSIDELVKSLISHFRPTEEEHLKVDIGPRMFKSVNELKKHVRNILTKTEDDTELRGEDFDLMLELLGYHSSRNVKKNVDAIFASTHKNPRFKGLRCFFYRNKEGKVDFFSYARCCDNVKTRGQLLTEQVGDILVEIWKLSPNVLGTITETIDRTYPHHKVQIEHHISFTKAILYISRRIPSSRTEVYNIIIKKLTTIDSEIKMGDPNTVDVEKMEKLRSEKLKEMADQLIKGEVEINESKSKLENPEWFKKIYEKLRTEEDIDDMSQKMDFLMGIVFEELEDVLRENMKKVKVRNVVRVKEESDSEDETMRTPIGRTKLNETKMIKGVKRESSEDLDDTSTTASSSRSSLEAKEFIKHEYYNENNINNNKNNNNNKINNNYSNNHSDNNNNNINNINNYNSNNNYNDNTNINKITNNTDNKLNIGNYKHNNKGDCWTESDGIVEELLEEFEKTILPTYNCKYVQFIYFFALAMNPRWVKMYLQKLFSVACNAEEEVNKRRTSASYAASFICRSNYIEEELVCGSMKQLFKILKEFDNVALNQGRAKEVYQRENFKKTKNYFTIVSTKLSLFYSILQDILYIICYKADVISASSSIMEKMEDPKTGLVNYLESYLNPISYCKNSIIEEAIKATKHYRNLKTLNESLIGLIQNKETNNEDIEDIKWSLYSPIDSFFPFDPYLLHHSRYYIRDKYKSKTINQIIQENNNNNVNSKSTNNNDSCHSTIKEDSYKDNSSYYDNDSNNVISDNKDSEDKIINEVVEAIRNEKELVEQEMKHVSKQLHDSLGFSSISRTIKARLEASRRTMSIDSEQIEADYDFWGYEASLEEMEQEEQTSPKIGGNHVILGIDQLGDMELSMCDTLVTEEEERKHGLLELLMSSKAYKSASINLKKVKKIKI